MRKCFPAVLAASIVLAAWSSCGFEALFTHELLLEPPALPKDWEGLAVDRYKLEWRDAEGRKQSASAEPGAGTVLTVARGGPQAILAYPEIGSTRLRPAGFLYPADCREDPDALPSVSPTVASLTYASGYAAEVAAKLEALGFDAFAFPLERLQACWVEKGKDPWALQPWKAAKALAEGAFRASLFPAAKVRVPLPPGTWLPESPFCSLSPLGDSVREATLPEGLSRFFTGQEVLEVRVEGEDYAILARDG